MNTRDREQLFRWVAGSASLAEVESASAVGLVGNVRFSERARRKFVWLWTWGADRHAGRAGALQDAFYARHGSAGLARRIERVLRALGARHA